MDRTANPLFKAGMAAITATTLVIAPSVDPPMPQAPPLPDPRTASVRLSSFASGFPLPPTAPEATGLPTIQSRLAPSAAPSPQPRVTAVSPHSAAAAPRLTSIAPSGSGPVAAAVGGAVVANSLTDGIDQAYQFIQYWVDYGVDVAQWAAGWVPVVGGLVSAQIGIVYDNLVRPIANSFVYNLVDPIINDPSFSNIVNSFGRFGGDIVNSVINFAWAEARYFLPPLPPLPGLAVQTAPEAVSTPPTEAHEDVKPFAKAIEDAKAHLAEALGLTKVDHTLTGLEKPGTAAETTTETSLAETPKEAKETEEHQVTAEGKAPAKDKAVDTAVDHTVTDKAAESGKEKATKETDSPKAPAKEPTAPGAVTGAEGTPAETAESTTTTKDAEHTKVSEKDTKDPGTKAPAATATKDKKTPATSTTEHGTVSAQGTVRGSTSHPTTGRSTAGKNESAASTSDAKKSDKTLDTKSDHTTKSPATKPDHTASTGKNSTHDSAGKSSGATKSSAKSDGGGSKSGGSSHD